LDRLTCPYTYRERSPSPSIATFVVLPSPHDSTAPLHVHRVEDTNRPNMPGPLLYSTNPFLKFYLQEQYYGGVHWVWCSESFDSAVLEKYTAGANVPPSSNPADLYRSLRDAVRRKDTHDQKIQAQKATYLTLAVEYERAGKITAQSLEDITYRVTNASFDDWRPLLYLVPRTPLGGRVKPVPASQCAGLGPEFTVTDLQRTEFDVIEP
jgi:hypothetical protein